MKTKKIFSLKVATELTRRGNTFLKTIPNYKKPGFLVYLFEDTEQLNAHFSEIMTRHKESV